MRFKREEIYVYLRLIHVDVWQKPAQYSKAIILQLKTEKINVWTNLHECLLSWNSLRIQVVEESVCIIKKLFNSEKLSSE